MQQFSFFYEFTFVRWINFIAQYRSLKILLAFSSEGPAGFRLCINSPFIFIHTVRSTMNRESTGLVPVPIERVESIDSVDVLTVFTDIECKRL